MYCSRGKGDALERDSESNHIPMISEKIIEKLIRQHVDIDQIQLCFMPGCRTMDAIFILRQLKVKYLTKKEFVLCICRSGEGF